MQEKKVLEILEENRTTPNEKEALLMHLACAEKLALDKVTKVWRDKNNVLCVGYANNSWFHYSGKGEWY